MLDTAHLLFPTTFPDISRAQLETLQVNLGYLCNQTCQHCHVNAGPKRTELMQKETIDQLLAYIDTHEISAIDLTGGAPELNPEFRYLVSEARQRGVRVIDRCNLTVLEEEAQEDLAAFLAEQRVEVVASLPCYLKDNVDNQRGKGVFETSIAGLKRLNALGYGQDGSGLLLNLVFNPQGATLPPAQTALEADYKKQLWESYGVRFNQLFTITNMPISRFGSMLLSKGEFKPYMQLLKASYSSCNLATVMCRSLISVDWRGYVYDCDFNQMLGMHLETDSNERPHISDLMDIDLQRLPIRTGEHCYGCTAGQGSSCGGALGE
ncbi:arsenosugar biosynthesis radical SAM (seleno)protein ArsS [Solemya velesiana gill symbiont]|uniref:Radical SAM protein n=1 Tax=Solemya velesiana gill symbiont TaxID=1918948 RepID=A0A1T2KXZ8_9GAMM|nr:arsenosugar biosynthesis radical SAM (seleno)protein ArsS [Solemya velesiana gill symbiont]OOZ37702.1 radical SAM protein [Solemya velesiana gill symbiont]